MSLLRWAQERPHADDCKGERVLTKYEFVEVFKKQAAQIIQLDVGHCGGILESKKIAGMAEAHYARLRRICIADRSSPGAEVPQSDWFMERSSSIFFLGGVYR